MTIEESERAHLFMEVDDRVLEDDNAVEHGRLSTYMNNGIKGSLSKEDEHSADSGCFSVWLVDF